MRWHGGFFFCNLEKSEGMCYTEYNHQRKRESVMLKKIFFIGFVILLCFTVSSCAFVPFSKNRDLYDTVSIVSYDENGWIDVVRYQDCNYVRVDGIFDEYGMKKVAVGIRAAYVWKFAVGYQTWFYGDTADHPIYLYGTLNTGLFLREDYDYKKDEFVIEGTEEGVVFSQMFTDERVTGEVYERVTDFRVYSKKYPELQIQMGLYRETDNRWSVICGEKWFFLTDEFVQYLIANGIIE